MTIRTYRRRQGETVNDPRQLSGAEVGRRKRARREMGWDMSKNLGGTAIAILPRDMRKRSYVTIASGTKKIGSIAIAKAIRDAMTFDPSRNPGKVKVYTAEERAALQAEYEKKGTR